MRIDSIKHFSYRKISDYILHKDIASGKHANELKILKHKTKNDYIVVKRYEAKYKNIFFNEVYWLIQLYNTGWFPRLIRIDTSSLKFWMTYCGESLDKDKFGEYREIIKNMERLLLNDYGCYHNDIKPGNACIKNNKLYLIDCGWMTTERIFPGYTKGRYGHLYPNCFADMEDKCKRLINEKNEIKTRQDKNNNLNFS